MSLQSLETWLLRDAGEAHGLDEVVDPPGRDAADPGLLDDRDQRLLGHPARLEERREVAALAQLRDAELQGPEPGVEASGHGSRCDSSAGRASARAGRRRPGPRHRPPSGSAARPRPRCAGSRPRRPSAASSASANLSSVIGSSVGPGEASQLHPSRPTRWPPPRRRRTCAELVTVAPARRLRLELPPRPWTLTQNSAQH